VLGFNAMFHLLSLLLFAGMFFYILKLKKKQSLVERIWFGGNERVLVSPRDFLPVFGQCLCLDEDGVNSLTANLTSDKKLLNTDIVRKLAHKDAWSIASNRLVFRPGRAMSDDAEIRSALKGLQDFLGSTVDIIEPT
jgi:hypothetical protein